MSRIFLHHYSKTSTLSTVMIFFTVTLTLTGQTLQQNLPIANGSVYAIAFDSASNTIYLGGSFNSIAPYSGREAAIDTTTGNFDPAFPKVNARIRSIVLDGSGGHYIAGNFTLVGGLARNRIAHIKADKSVDAGFNPDVNGEIRALVRSGSILYIAGSFTTVGGQARNRIAALDAATGLVTSWDPNSNNDVWALAVSDSTIYAGGYFTNIGGQTRNHIAALDSATGSATTWNPNANDAVFTLADLGYGSTSIYVGGNFSTIGGQTRICLAEIFKSSGGATNWNPKSGGYVLTLALTASTVYAGGAFTGMNDTSSFVARNYIAAINRGTGLATSWNPSANQVVDAFAVSGSTIYVSGDFTSIGGQPRNKIAALNPVTGAATSWNPNAGWRVFALAISGSTILAGGDFDILGGQTRNNIAAINGSTGMLTNWNPNANNPVRALALAGSTIYAGGDFTNIGGQTRNRIAAIDATSGLATSWNAGADGTVRALAATGSTVYAGGTFTSIGGQTRSCIAAMNAVTGLSTSWNPNVNSEVRAIALSGSTVYAGGEFSFVGGQTRNYIAAIDSTSGVATSWNPNSDWSVYALAVSGSTVYAGGQFTTIGGLGRNHIAAFDTSTGSASSWNPNVNNYVLSLATSGSTVYAGGAFTVIKGQVRNRIAAIDAATGVPTGWNPNPNGRIEALALSYTDHSVYAGGPFDVITGDSRPGFAGMTNPADLSLPVELITFAATVTGLHTELRWMTATETNNYGFEIERKQIPNSNLEIRNWGKVGFVPGSGTSSSPHQYSFLDINASTGRNVYRIKQIDKDGGFKYTGEAEVEVGLAPKTLTLGENYPNPFNPSTTIEFTVPQDGRAVLKVFNILGQDVATLFEGDAKSGYFQRVVFDATKLASGVYFSKLEFGGKQILKKIVLMK